MANVRLLLTTRYLLLTTIPFFRPVTGTTRVFLLELASLTANSLQPVSKPARPGERSLLSALEEQQALHPSALMRRLKLSRILYGISSLVDQALPGLSEMPYLTGTSFPINHRGAERIPPYPGSTWT